MTQTSPHKTMVTIMRAVLILLGVLEDKLEVMRAGLVTQTSPHKIMVTIMKAALIVLGTCLRTGNGVTGWLSW